MFSLNYHTSSGATLDSLLLQLDEPSKRFPCVGCSFQINEFRKTLRHYSKLLSLSSLITYFHFIFDQGPDISGKCPLSEHRSRKDPSPHSSSKYRKPYKRRGTSKSSPNMGRDKGDGRHLIKPSPNLAYHVEPSPAEKKEAEEIARDILGHFEAPTVKIIIKLQATRMHPLEWKLVRDVLNYDKKAETDLARLARMLEDWGKDGSY